MPRRRAFVQGLCGGVGVSVAGCLGGSDAANEPTVTTIDAKGSLQITSPAFDEGETIPAKYTSDGQDRSPPLTISGVPDDAASLALIVDDPDAPNPPFTHWLLWGVPTETTTVPAGISQSRTVSILGGAKQGTNSFDELGYRGPKPPKGAGPHTYRFTLYAVRNSLTLQPGADRTQVVLGIAGESRCDCAADRRIRTLT
ncbi:MAG: YbhB/YbcL family Raf kinase inhibitor-like protein [Halorientalis sp.]